MTAATYAALPHGPQLNNYAELVGLIREADETQAEPLTEHEERILARIAGVFPKNQDVYKASHKERAYTNRKSGELILYTDAESMTGFSESNLYSLSTTSPSGPRPGRS